MSSITDLCNAHTVQALPMAEGMLLVMQEDDVIGILASDNIADLKPLGDRLLVEVSSMLCKWQDWGLARDHFIPHVLSPYLPCTWQTV